MDTVREVVESFYRVTVFCLSVHTLYDADRMIKAKILDTGLIIGDFLKRISVDVKIKFNAPVNSSLMLEGLRKLAAIRSQDVRLDIVFTLGRRPCPAHALVSTRWLGSPPKSVHDIRVYGRNEFFLVLKTILRALYGLINQGFRVRVNYQESYPHPSTPYNGKMYNFALPDSLDECISKIETCAW